MPRLPDFILIGAMKAGTTTLFRRLAEVDGIQLPETKEPHFFSLDGRWARGQQWYESLFRGCTGITGEASASYSNAARADVTAERMASVVPDAKILYAIRDPVERMRSHYRHQVLRARETRPLGRALADSENEYLACSLYGEVLKAYRTSFPAEQILVYRLDELDDPAGRAWTKILTHIGSAPAPMPPEHHNVSAEKRRFTRPLLWLWERGLEPEKYLPSPVRRFGKAVLTRQAAIDRGPLATVDEPIPDFVLERLQADARVLREMAVDIEVS